MKGIKLGKIFGIELLINPSWFVIFVLLSAMLAAPSPDHPTSTVVRYTVGIITSLIFFASVLLHELAHSLVAKRFKLPVNSIVLHVFGGVSQMEREPARARDELLIASAGPLTSILLGIFFGIIWYLTRRSLPIVTAPAQYLFMINIALGLFNLIPGFPIDGGRILRAIIWGVTKDFRKATKIAARIGQGIAAAFIMLALYLVMIGYFEGLWLGLIGLYLLGMARSSYQQVELQYRLRGLKVGSLSLEDLQQISGKLNIADFLDNYVIGARDRHYMVVDDNMIRGVVSLNQLSNIDEKTRNIKRIEQVMTPINDLKRIDPETEVIQALELMSQLNTSQLPVVRNDELLGFIGKDALLSYIRKRFEFGT